MDIQNTDQKKWEISFDEFSLKDSYIYLKVHQLSSNLSTATTTSSNRLNTKRVKFNPTVEYCHFPSYKKYNSNHLNYKTVKTSKDIVIVPENNKKCVCLII